MLDTQKIYNLPEEQVQFDQAVENAAYGEPIVFRYNGGPIYYADTHVDGKNMRQTIKDLQAQIEENEELKQSIQGLKVQMLCQNRYVASLNQKIREKESPEMQRMALFASDIETRLFAVEAAVAVLVEKQPAENESAEFKQLWINNAVLFTQNRQLIDQNNELRQEITQVKRETD